MLNRLVWFPLKPVMGGFCFVGIAALVLAAMTARPLPPPELRSISETARAVGATLPTLKEMPS